MAQNTIECIGKYIKIILFVIHDLSGDLKSWCLYCLVGCHLFYFSPFLLLIFLWLTCLMCYLVGRLVTSVVDVGPPADWVKINIRQTVCAFKSCSLSFLSVQIIYIETDWYWSVWVQKDCFEVYALVPGLLREEVCTLFSYALPFPRLIQGKKKDILPIYIIGLIYIFLSLFLFSKLRITYLNKYNIVLTYWWLRCEFNQILPDVWS